VRQPAAFCGVTGLKPTYGRVSRFGMIAFASSLDQAGVFARSALDCAHVLAAIAGHDPRDATSVPRAVDDYVSAVRSVDRSRARASVAANPTSAAKAASVTDAASSARLWTAADSAVDPARPLAGLRIGVVREKFGAGVDLRVGDAVHGSLRELELAGAKLVDLGLPSLEHAIPAYYVIAPAEASANLSRYDGVRYGHRCDAPRDLEDLYTRSRDEGFGAEVKRRILIGAYVLSAGYYDAYYRRAQQVRRLIVDEFLQAFSEVDLLAGPTTPTAAFRLGEKTDPLAMYAADINTVAANLAGLPAISLPSGFVDGLPVGLQLMAPAFAEARLLAAGHVLQQRTDHHLQRPRAFHA
jgi:aspartyl-tRNA(Asn)/glutamyl-tRNA(Gln) amidotransferase subunit A